jgi:DHA2 family multidrug resistance protein
VGILSLILSSRVVVDPPHLAEARKRVGSIDYVGLSLIAVGLGALELVLDKGQESDWFASNLITAFSIVSAIALVAFVVWEWRHKHPVVEVRLFKQRSFAVANLMMLTLGVALFGSTLLLPQYLQVWMGYSAEQAGQALSPGALVVILLLPFVGRLVTRFDPRWLIAFGFLVLSAALFHMTRTLYPGIDFRTAMMLRVYQSCGLAFLFVPINTIVYAGVPLEKNNSVSGIVNLSRNMGGDIGIAFVTTLIARRSQFHQANLSAGLTPGSVSLSSRLHTLARGLFHAGTSAADAVHHAYGALYRQLVQQAQTLAYLDALYFLGWFTLAMVPLVLLTRPVSGGRMAAH